MTDLEISKALALAIGWKEKHIRLTYEFGVQVCTDAPHSCYTSMPWWRGFDYRDWAVAGPIAEKFDCFPMRSADKVIQEDDWFTFDIETGASSSADTPQKAIALAVIGSKK